MILKTFDGKEMYISQEQADAISIALQQPRDRAPKVVQITLPSGVVTLAVGAIASIIPGGNPPIDRTRQLAEAHKETSEEEIDRRERNKKKLAEMRADLVSRGVLKA